MRRLARPLLVIVFTLSAVGCVTPTRFYGAAKVAGGAEACRTRCELQGLEFAGMVFMGEYTDGCICREPAVPGDETLESGAGVSAGGVAGQIRAEQVSEENDQRHLEADAED